MPPCGCSAVSCLPGANCCAAEDVWEIEAACMRSAGTPAAASSAAASPAAATGATVRVSDKAAACMRRRDARVVREGVGRELWDGVREGLPWSRGTAGTAIVSSGELAAELFRCVCWGLLWGFAEASGGEGGLGRWFRVGCVPR